MNDISSKIRKAGLWVWNQKEKMFLGALLVVLCFRVYVVLINPPDVNGDPNPPDLIDKPPLPAPSDQTGGFASPDAVPDPPARPIAERAEDYRPMVRQNPFTIWSLGAQGSGASDTEGDSIDVNLINIVKWNDGTYRAELSTKVVTKPKRYKEGEVFENYKLMSIDPGNKSVTIYSSAHDKTFELKIP